MPVLTTAPLLPSMRLLLALCALFLAPFASAQPRHGGVFAFAGSGGDCQGLYATTRQVLAYAQPLAVGNPVRRVEAGRRIGPSDVAEELNVVIRPGRFVARRNVTFDEWSFYDRDRQGSGPLQIPRGMSIEVFGQDLWRMNGVVYQTLWAIPATRAGVDADVRRDFTTESFPQVEHWLRLAARGGQPAAWLNASGPGVRRTGDAPNTGEGC